MGGPPQNGVSPGGGPLREVVRTSSPTWQVFQEPSWAGHCPEDIKGTHLILPNAQDVAVIMIPALRMRKLRHWELASAQALPASQCVWPKSRPSGSQPVLRRNTKNHAG